MFKENNKFEKFESKVWLSSPTMHGPEIEYVKERKLYFELVNVLLPWVSEYGNVKMHKYAEDVALYIKCEKWVI